MLQETSYGLSVSLEVAFDVALDRTQSALKTEGFGVLTTIDMQKALLEKLGRDIGRYVILGACNPALAERAVAAEREIGLLLPCNVIVYEGAGGQCTVAAMAPLAALGVVGDNPELRAVAVEADARLRRALEHIAS